jgi:hypothetical protein
MADPAADGDAGGTYPTFIRTADEIDQRVAALIAQLAQTTTREEHP